MMECGEQYAAILSLGCFSWNNEWSDKSIAKENSRVKRLFLISMKLSHLHELAQGTDVNLRHAAQAVDG